MLPARLGRKLRLPVSVLTTAAMLGAGLVAATPAQAVSPDLVISQVYGGGGNSGATYTHDFVEIFNRGTSAADLGGLSVQYTSATGTGNFGASATAVTDLPDLTVQPGQYVLVQEATNAAVGSALPTPDVTDTTPIPMAGGAGKVALVIGTLGLGCNGGSTPCDENLLTRIVDLVGYGTGASGANFFEGTGPAPTISAILSDQRDDHGCQDTDDNAADFAALAPAPRNTGTTLAPCDGTPPGDSAPTVSSTTPGNGATGVPVNSNLTVTFSEAVAAADAFSVTCATSGAHALAVTGGATTFTLDPTDDFTAGEQCTAAVAAAAVADADLTDPPDNMAANYSWSFGVVAPPSCDDPQTHLVSQVQGSGATSPIVALPAAQRVVTVEAVVTAIKPGLSGFFIEEEADDQDDSTATSEGVFVRGAVPAGVVVGDLVQVTGGVAEFVGTGSSQTQISNNVTVLDCGTSVPVEPIELTFPVAELSDFEHVEGMLITMPQDVVISEYFNYARFNEVVVGVPPNGDDRFPSPTSIQEPSTTGTAALLADYAKRRITIDDGRSASNPAPLYFPGTVDTPFSLTNSFRGGDTLTDVTGVVEHTFGLYRVHPTTDGDYTSVNPRTSAPEDVGGSLKVASFNVLNYFNTFNDPSTPGEDCTFGVGGDESDCRGAESTFEFERQADKIVSAITKLDADVVGLIEIENDGYGPDSAMQDLANRLNAVSSPADRYTVLDVDYLTGETNAAGTDAIKVGFIYRASTVSPIGDTAVLNTGAFGLFDVVGEPEPIGRSRPAVAQTFVEKGTGGRATVVVNHLKSKSSSCAGNISPVGPDPDIQDGQGNCNKTRLAAARELVAWLDGNPTSINESDRLIIGDLNAYEKEDPVDAIRAAGYTDLLDKFVGDDAYSYVFDGQVGYLDHALASASLVSQVAGITEWHINADEPPVLDYNTNFKPASLIDSLYAPDPYRSSDHDPVLIGLNLKPQGGAAAR